MSWRRPMKSIMKRVPKKQLLLCCSRSLLRKSTKRQLQIAAPPSSNLLPRMIEPERGTLWMGVAHVKAKPGTDMLHGAGAFVAVIVLATDRLDVFAKVKRKLDSSEMMLARIE